MKDKIVYPLLVGLAVCALWGGIGSYFYKRNISKAVSKAQKEIYNMIAEGKYRDIIPKTKDLPEDKQLYYRGFAHYLQFDYVKAAECFKKYLEDNPHNVDVRLAQGHACLHAGLTCEAIREFDEVLKKDPNNNRAIKGLGQAYLENGDLKSAILTLLPLYNKCTTDPDIYLYLGKAYLYNGEIKKAKDTFSRMYEILRVNGQKCRRGASPFEGLLAHAYFLSGDYSNAINTLKDAVRIYPYPSYYWALARLCEMANNLSDAMNCCEEALEQNPESKEIKEYMETLEKKIRTN